LDKVAAAAALALARPDGDELEGTVRQNALEFRFDVEADQGFGLDVGPPSIAGSTGRPMRTESIVLQEHESTPR
jgi:hypothetical protein